MKYLTPSIVFFALCLMILGIITTGLYGVDMPKYSQYELDGIRQTLPVGAQFLYRDDNDWIYFTLNGKKYMTKRANKFGDRYIVEVQ